MPSRSRTVLSEPSAPMTNRARTVMLSAIARAWYYEPNKDRLKRFCDVVKNPSVSQGENESAAVSIRTYMIDKAAIASSSAMWADTFMKIQNSIKYFMEGKKLTVIKAVNTEAYPLDGRRVRKK